MRPGADYAPEYPKPAEDKGQQFQNNVIVEGGKTTNINIPVDMSTGNLSGEPDPKFNGRPQPPGSTGSPSVDSAPQSEPGRREIRDRWRIAFPEYDRYGDKGAQGRDIQFRRKISWYNPYDQNVLKGDYPIIGQKTFLILSGVSNSIVEQNRTHSDGHRGSDPPAITSGSTISGYFQ